MTKALIVGGGVAGCATALALRQAGVPSVVYEAHASGGDDAGAFLTVMANGMAALTAIDADRHVIDASYPAAAVELFDAEGRHLRHRPIEGPARTLSRATLYRVLQNLAVSRGIPVVHGKRLVDARTIDGSGGGRETGSETSSGTGGGTGVEVRFADGDRAEGDILVGADGIHSRTRHLIDLQAPTPRHTGQHVVYGYADGAPAGSAPDAYHMVFGSRAFFGFTAPGDGRTWWFARIPGERRSGRLTAEQWRDLALAAVRDDATPAAAIVEATGGDVVGGDSYDIPTTPNWHGDRRPRAGSRKLIAQPEAGPIGQRSDCGSR